MKGKEVALKKVGKWQSITALISLIGIVGILTSPIAWIWYGFPMFGKVILTSIFVLIGGKFLNHVSSLVRKSIQDVPDDSPEQHILDCIKTELLDDNVNSIEIIKDEDRKAENWVDGKYTGRHLYKY